MPVGVLEEVLQELLVEAFLEQVGSQDAPVEEEVGVGAAGCGDERLAGELAGDLLADHGPVLREVVQLEFADPAELLLFLDLVGPDGKAGARVGDGPETAGRALQLDGAFVEGDAPVLLDGALDEVPRVAVQLVDVGGRDQQLDLRDKPREKGVIREVGRLGLGLDGRARGRLGLQLGGAHDEPRQAAKEGAREDTAEWRA